MTLMTEFKIKYLSPVLLVADLERAVQWYHGLGFETEFTFGGFYAALRKDGFFIHLKVADVRRKKPTAEHVDLVLSVDRVGELYEGLNGAGVEIVQPLRKQPYGLEFYIADLDGYVIAFVE